MNEDNVSWLRDFARDIRDNAGPLIVPSGGEQYAVTADGTPHIIPNLRHYPERLILTSLDALVTMLKRDPRPDEDGPLFVSVSHVEHVEVLSPYNEDFDRRMYYMATATDVPGWKPKETLDLEEAKVALQSRFQPNEGSAYLLRVLSSVTAKNEITTDDNGLVNTIVTTAGAVLKNAESIRPVNALRPYRTFQEVEQPESLFLTRIKAPKAGTPSVTFIEAAAQAAAQAAADSYEWKLSPREKEIQNQLGKEAKA